jgi:hypothetical protein
MQEAYILILKMFVDFCNVPEVGNFIISGMKISGANITAGYCYIDGELCRFEQTAGTSATLIKKNVVIQSLGFKNGNNENVFRFVNAQVDLIDGAALSDFTRVSPVFDGNYVHTDNNYSNAASTKLANIEAGAQVNIKPSWTAPAGAANEVLNKPNIINVLHTGSSIAMGDFPNDTVETRVINFPDVGTENYMVIGQFKSNNLPIGGNDPIVWTYRVINSSSFSLMGREFGGTQNVSFNYIIVAV